MKKIIPSYVRVPLIFALVFFGIEYAVDSGDKPAFIEYPIIAVFLVAFAILLIALEIMISAIDNITYHLLSEEEKKKLDQPLKVRIKENASVKRFMKALTKSKPIDEEGTLLLDHDYDGIKELDNVLPPWWLYGFYISIIFAVVYFVRYEVLGADNQVTEFDKEVAAAQVAIEKYKKTAVDLIDANSVTQLADAESLAKGKVIFDRDCVVCHMADGGGGIGPNFTDDHWILGGGIKNVFHTITEGGRDGKGMVAWKAVLKPSEIQQVASFILSLQGTTPANPKEPEGDIIWTPAMDSEGGAEEAPVTNSTDVTLN